MLDSCSISNCSEGWKVIMVDINTLFSMLSWDSDEETQQAGIREAQEIEYLSILFQPIESKAVWENCAKVIASKSNEILDKYLFCMFEWLQDINWPGTEIIHNRLLEMPVDMLRGVFQFSLKQAKFNDDFSWEQGLLYFQEEYLERHPNSELNGDL